jgi:sigma-B regulation protein RsbU (phosphoserine phosphatase)
VDLRTKLFLLLASVALVPLALFGVLEYDETVQLSKQVAEANRVAVVGGLTRLLNRTVRSSSSYLDELSDVCTLAAQIEAAAVERSLARGEGLRSADLRSRSEALYREHPGLFVNIVTALADGSYVVAPNRPMPRGFDPRRRAWYEEAVAAGKRVWTEPFVSASTRSLTMAVAMPVRGPDDRPVGVVAVEFAIVDLLHQIDRTTFDYATSPSGGLAQIADAVESLLVVPLAAQPGRERQLAALADRSYRGAGSDWRVPPRAVPLDAPAGSSYRAVIANVSAGQAGVARLPFRDRDSLWAYAPVGSLHGALLVVLPYDRINATAGQESLTLRGRAASALRTSLAIAFVIVAIVGLLALVVSGVATQSIRELVAVTERIASGDLRARATVRGGDEIATLATAINAMVPKLEHGLQMQATLDLARAVQQNVLPNGPPAIEGFEIFGASLYCDEMGGDYYDYLEFDDGHRVAIAIGDVSGHGIAAAFLMAQARAILRSSLQVAGGLADAIRRTNALLCADIDDGSFMTMLLVAVGDDRTIRWVNAGHDPPLVFRAADAQFTVLEGADVPLGIDPDWSFAERTATLPTGDLVLVLGTDGIWESTDANGKEYGRARYRETVRANAGRSAQELTQAILLDVARFRGSAPPTDDVTLVVVKCPAVAAPASGGSAQGSTAAPA